MINECDAIINECDAIMVEFSTDCRVLRWELEGQMLSALIPEQRPLCRLHRYRASLLHPQLPRGQHYPVRPPGPPQGHRGGGARLRQRASLGPGLASQRPLRRLDENLLPAEPAWPTSQGLLHQLRPFTSKGCAGSHRHHRLRQADRQLVRPSARLMIINTPPLLHL